MAKKNAKAPSVGRLGPPVNLRPGGSHKQKRRPAVRDRRIEWDQEDARG
jgi:hypothetical protein